MKYLPLLLLLGCSPLPEDPRQEGRFTCEAHGTPYLTVYTIHDTKTGLDYIAVNGHGITQMQPLGK